MKDKGFTLIELLAVIVILAIIALVLVPIVSDVIESAGMAAFKESVDGMIDSTDNYLNEYVLKHNNELTDFPVTFTCDGEKCKNSDDEELIFKGKVPSSGDIIINKDGVLAKYITNGKYCSYGYKWNIVIEKNCETIDFSGPIISAVRNGRVVTLNLVDKESGVDKYCGTKVANSATCEWITSSNSNAEEYTIDSAGTWYFYAKDKKGNISEEYKMEIGDAFAPTISGARNGKVVTLTMADDASGVASYCATKSSELSACEWITSVNPSVENYTVDSMGTWYFYAKDNSDNVSEAIQIEVDDVFAPTISGSKSTKVAILSMSDEGSGVDKYCGIKSSNSFDCEWLNPTKLNDERFVMRSAGTWYFYAKDKNGNISDPITIVAAESDYCQYGENQVVGTYDYTGSGVAFTVPTGCAGTYKLEVWGAQGGTTTAAGGKGGYSEGEVVLTDGDTIYVVVGQIGQKVAGGWNGGGKGWKVNGKWGGAGGGGATHISKTNTILKSTAVSDLYIVAGGGGGGGARSGAVGGAGGGTSGIAGKGGDPLKVGGTNSGGGGTQTKRGCEISSSANTYCGAYGQGGNVTSEDGSGGGGGYYGGGGSGYYIGGTGGGGGSGYIGGVTNGTTIAGNASMPTHDGTSTMTGNSSNGYAKITFIEE